MNDILIQDNLLGPAAPELGWVPAPRYLLRRQRILRQLAHVSPCEVLEIGPGAGMLLQELAQRGFSCHALETSIQAQTLIRELSEESGHHIHVRNAPEEGWAARFPLLMAFEVLEHIEDDVAALRQWAEWLAPAGTLLLSVPAHQDRWNARDVWAGHVRRYERQQLLSAFDDAGLLVQEIECYGFPLANVLEVVGDRRYRRNGHDSSGRDANTANSGVDRSADAKWFPLLGSWPGKMALRAAFAMQAASSRTPFGNGWLVRATHSQ